MLSYYQAIILGLLQGVSELFPISSLGHSVILPRLLGWNIHQNDGYFLTFLIATHFATAIVLFLFFIKDWYKILLGFLRSIKEREIKESDTYAKLAWLLIIGTIPAGIIGILFQDTLRTLFASAQIAAFFLFLNGFLLLGAEKLRKITKQNELIDQDLSISKLRYLQAAKIGLIQVIALIPGLSRTGSTIAGSLLVGLSHRDSIRFSFLLATPIIGAAALLKLPDVFTSYHALFGQFIVGFFASAISAFFAVTFLTKYFQKNTLLPFGIYCLVIGGVTSLLFFFT